MSRSLYDKLYRRFGTTLPETEVVARSRKLIDADQAAFSVSALGRPCDRLKRTKVAVVGGGFAGMMAAWQLCHREPEIEVVVFEAGAEVGGRVSSNEEFAEGRIIEFGAELVGANHPTLLEMCRVLGVTVMMRTGESDYDLFQLDMPFRVDGKNIDRATAKQVNDDLEKLFLKIAVDARKVQSADRPWTQPDLQKFDQMTILDALTRPPPDGFGLDRTKLVFRMLDMQLGNNLVMPIGQVSYLGLLCLIKGGLFGDEKDLRSYLGYWQQTETYRNCDGNQAIAKRMVAGLSDKSNPRARFKFTLLTKTQVTEIKVDKTQARPVTLKWKPAGGAADRLQPNPFDYVILATPPTVWGDITVTPEHPNDTIGRPQTGPAIKFFSNLKDRFWHAEKAAPSGISSDIGMIWEATDNQTQVGKQEIDLAVFAGGLSKTGRILTESEIVKGLNDLYKGYAESSRGRKRKLVNWQDKPFIKIGYSAPRKGHIFSVAPELQVPLNESRMFLAGEHTQTDFFGFMEGALRSGRRVAEALIAHVCSGRGPEA